MKTSIKVLLVIIGIGLAVIAAVALAGIAATIDGKFQRPSRITIAWMCLAGMNAAATLAYGTAVASLVMIRNRPRADSPR